VAIQSGNRVGPYEVLARIGVGGMGEVYRARDVKLGRDIALKVLTEAFASDAERMARFQREAKVLASLNHPNIASIYGLEDSGNTPALVMELVEGPTLADRIQLGPIPIDEALDIAKQLSEGLEYAHERGIVHRDLKPANVKVANDGTAKILDFGLAKAVEGDPASIDISTSPTISRLATQAGILLGTAAYMSPEQAKGRQVDRRADIWAFGCVVYEMLTGKMAFQGDSVADTLAAVIKQDPDWSRLPAATPLGVRQLLQRCLKKDAKQRLQAIGDARLALEEVLTGTPDAAPLPAGEVVSVSYWHRALPWALSGALAVALAAGALMVRFDPEPRAPAEAMRFQVRPAAMLANGGAFALSPDGRQLAFVAMTSDGVPRLWIHSLNALEARPLSGSELSSTPPPFFWSPDSRYIAFEDNGGKLKKIDIFGGGAETVCDLHDTVAIGGSWNRDGVIIFGASNGGLMQVSANGGPVSPLTTIDKSQGETGHLLPSFLPDGRHFIYHRSSTEAGDHGIFIGSLGVKPEQQSSQRLLESDFGAAYVASSDPGLGQLLFVRDGALMTQPFDAHHLELKGEPATIISQVGTFREFGFFSASANDVLVYRTGGGGEAYQLTWLDREGKILGKAGKPGVYSGPALSPDGTRAAVSESADVQNAKNDLWLVDFSRGTTTRFTFGSSATQDPVWSPDGKRIVFPVERDGIYDLYQKPASGAEDEALLLKSGDSKYPSSVSRDGRFLLYFANNPKTKYDLWVLPLDGSAKPFPFLQTESNEIDGHFSPNGQWVAYASDESGRYEIYVRRFSPDTPSAAGGKWQISYNGGSEPRWSTDGRELYYLSPDWKLMVVEITTGPLFQPGTPKLLFQAPQQSGLTAGDYTVDGKHFLFLAPAEQGDAPFTVVVNWQADLKK
jgi:eukaryotic-like serine/threonine-protein kinase